MGIILSSSFFTIQAYFSAGKYVFPFDFKLL